MQGRIVHPILPFLRGVLLVVVAIARKHICPRNWAFLPNYLAECLYLVGASLRVGISIHSYVSSTEYVLQVQSLVLNSTSKFAEQSHQVVISGIVVVVV